MAFGKMRFAALFGVAMAGLAMAYTPAQADAIFDYTFQQSSGPDAVSGTLELELTGTTNLTYTPQSNVPLADVLAITLVLNGVTYTLDTPGASFTALQFNDRTGTLRDLTFSGTVGGNTVHATSIFQFLPNGGRVFDNGTFVFGSSHNADPVPVPEPGSLWLMLSALCILMLGFVVRHKPSARTASA